MSFDCQNHLFLTIVTGSSNPTDLQFTPLSGKLSMTESKTASGSEVYIMAFTGVNLKEAELKALMESCVKQVIFFFF